MAVHAVATLADVEEYTVMGLTRRAGTIASAIAAVLVVSTAAYAWIDIRPTTGHGAATTGGPLQNITVSGPTGIALVLDQPVALSGSFTNDNTFRVSVARVHVEVVGISGDASTCPFRPDALKPNFLTTDAVPPTGHRFEIAGATDANGVGSGDWSGGSVVFRSSPSFDQTACLGRKLILRYTAAAS